MKLTCFQIEDHIEKGRPRWVARQVQLADKIAKEIVLVLGRLVHRRFEVARLVGELLRRVARGIVGEAGRLLVLDTGSTDATADRRLA